MEIPAEAVDAAARTLWRFQTSETWEERERMFPDSTDLARTLDKARMVLAVAVPHLPDYRWQLRAEHLELAIKAATDPNSDRYDDYHWLLNQVNAFPSPSVQRSSSND